MKKTAIVTGGSRGIGEACVRILANKGYNVLLNYNSSNERANSIKEELLKEGYNVDIFKADVSKKDDVESLFEFCAKRFGKVDVLVNNAGISQEKLFIDITDEDFERMINTNLKSVFYCSKLALIDMIGEKSGSIINISSIWGVTGASCEVHYSAAKAGVIGMTKALAKEVGPSNIRVNAIAPGVIKTDMISQFSNDDLNVLVEETPLMRLGTPMDIAKCVAFLASDDSSFITGQVIGANGGFLI